MRKPIEKSQRNWQHSPYAAYSDQRAVCSNPRSPRAATPGGAVILRLRATIRQMILRPSRLLSVSRFAPLSRSGFWMWAQTRVSIHGLPLRVARMLWLGTPTCRLRIKIGCPRARAACKSFQSSRILRGQHPLLAGKTGRIQVSSTGRGVSSTASWCSEFCIIS